MFISIQPCLFIRASYIFDNEVKGVYTHSNVVLPNVKDTLVLGHVRPEDVVHEEPETGLLLGTELLQDRAWHRACPKVTLVAG